MSGNITKRGEHSWRLKFDIGRDAGGKRLTRFCTIRGTKKQAQIELTRLMAAHDAGNSVGPTKLALAEYMRAWITTAEAVAISPKTAERYRQLIDRQIIPHLGHHALQKLKASHIADWHATLLTRGGIVRKKSAIGEKNECAPLKARTVGHAHRVLHKALADATQRELLTRNPAALVSPPKVATAEMAILSGDNIKHVLATLRTSPIFAEIVLLISTGMRRGELAGLQWGDVDLDAHRLRIERSIEKTKAQGLRIKSPKTSHGRRTVALPAAAASVLREHRRAQLEQRVALGLGKLPPQAFVFGTLEGELRDPDKLTWDWRRLTIAKKLPRVSLHTLRHSHASALIAAGTDPVTVSRRLGHGSPAVTMSVYAHLFDRGDEAAAEAIDRAIGLDEHGHAVPSGQN